MIGAALIIIIALIALVWVLAEVQKLKHKIWAFFLIILIVFAYISFALVLKDQDVDYTSPSGLIQAGKVYFSWLGSMFGNFKTMTSHAIKLDWQPPEDEVKNTVEEK
jgi:glucan phosphoethanolaminetransferase (alkaline phosphatase superfamily)